MRAILQDHNLAFGMVSNVLAGFGTIGCIDPHGDIIAEDRATVSNSPSGGVEADDIHRRVVCYSEADEALREVGALIVVLAIGQGLPVPWALLEVEGTSVGELFQTVLPQLVEGEGEFRAGATFLDADGELPAEVGGPEEVAFGAGGIEGLDDGVEALCGDVEGLVVGELGEAVHR